MAMMEGLEIYIPLEAEVWRVPLCSLPKSVLRKMGPSAKPKDTSHCVRICPALFQRKGQKEMPQGHGMARQQVLTVLGNSLSQRSGSAQCTAHWKMSFVTANTTAYKVLKETLPTASVPQGPLSNCEQDAVIIHHGRIYLSVKRRKTELPASQTPAVSLRRLSSDAAGQSSSRSLMAPVTHHQLKRKLDSPCDATKRPLPSPETSPSQGAGLRANCREASSQRASQSQGINQGTSGTGRGESQGSGPSREPRQETSPALSNLASPCPSYSASPSPVHAAGPSPSSGANQDANKNQEAQDESSGLSPSQSSFMLPGLTPSDPLGLPYWSSSVPSARQQEFEFQELAKREKIARMKAKLLENEAGLDNL